MSTLKLPKALVSVEWLAENMDHPDLVILDATIPKVTGKTTSPKKEILRIKNARFIDLNNHFRDLDKPLPNTLPRPKHFEKAAQKLGIHKDSVIVVYDRLGIYSSPRAWWLFRVMGHANIAVLDGGFPAWQATGLPCEPRSAYTGPVGNFKARFQASMVVYTPEVLAAIKDPKKIVLDARSNGRFYGTEPEPRANLRGGHIPNSRSLPHSEIIKDGQFVTIETLRAAFKAEELEGKKAIFSCGSGITACVLALGAELSGIENGAVYDGSWTEWASDLELPVAI